MRAWFWNYWGVLMDGLALHPPLGIFPDNTRHFYCLFIPAKESRKLLSWALGAAKTRLLLLKCSTVMGTSTPRNLLYHSSPSYLHLFTGETFSFYCINKRFPTCGSKVSEIVLSQDCLVTKQDTPSQWGEISGSQTSLGAEGQGKKVKAGLVPWRQLIDYCWEQELLARQLYLSYHCLWWLGSKMVMLFSINNFQRHYMT